MMDQDRTKYLGGSDCAGIMGMSRWTSPLKIWAEKTGTIIPEDISGKLCVKLGNKLEDTVAELFEEETGKKVHRVNETIIHPKYDFIRANIDRRVVGEDAILECKTCSSWKAKEWENEDIPREYILQCVHYLAVTGKAKCYIAVLIGNHEFKWKEIVRDETLIDELIKKEVVFWNDYVTTGVMPQVVSAQDSDTLDALYPKATKENPIQLQGEANALSGLLVGYKNELKKLENDIELTENRLKILLGENSQGETDEYRIAWVNSKYSGIDQKKLKADLPDIYLKYLINKETRRFSVKLRE